ncbi:hypothetical protein ACFL0M_01010 [Thermodesulfobacteriota bacterium]
MERTPFVLLKCEVAQLEPVSPLSSYRYCRLHGYYFGIDISKNLRVGMVSTVAYG